MAEPIHLTRQKFDEIGKKGVVLIDFWAQWCGPCRAIAPTVEELAKEYDGRVTVAKLNVDEERELAAQFGIMSIPTLIILKDGEVVDTIVGLTPKEQIEEKLNKHLG